MLQAQAAYGDPASAAPVAIWRNPAFFISLRFFIAGRGAPGTSDRDGAT